MDQTSGFEQNMHRNKGTDRCGHDTRHHMEDSDLCEVWVECDVLCANAAQNVISGKGYALAMRAHKLTLQAFWQLLLQ